MVKSHTNFAFCCRFRSGKIVKGQVTPEKNKKQSHKKQQRASRMVQVKKYKSIVSVFSDRQPLALSLLSKKNMTHIIFYQFPLVSWVS